MIKRTTIPLLTCILLFSLFSLFPAIPFAQEDSQRIVEEVGVNWWLIPLMAVDKKGEAVTDLKAGDIRVRVNGKPVTNITFIKSTFAMSQPVKEKPEAAEAVKDIPPVQPPPISREKVVFLVFDQVLSRSTSTLRSREIARSIINNAHPDTRFVIMRIHGFAGLDYIAQGRRGETSLTKFLDRKIKKFNNARTINLRDFVAPTGGGKTRGERLSPGEKTFKRREVASYYTRKSVVFFSAFETLYLHLNGIDANKFVYLFSEGVPNDFIRALPGGTAFYDNKIKHAANRLGRSGAVLFLVNPLGVDEGSDVTSNQKSDVSMTSALEDETGEKIMNFDEPSSGRYSMLSLATKSGGKYLEGTRQKIVERIDNMHRAYYEISFPDIKDPLGRDPRGRDPRGRARDISITSTRKGVSIVTLRSIERKKAYSSMTSIEKELLALNLVTGSPLARRRMTAFQAAVEKVKKKKNGTDYTLLLPPELVGKSLDLYKFSLNKEESEGENRESLVKKLEKETVTAKKNTLKLSLDISPGSRHYFVLLEPLSHSARVHGAYRYEDGPELMEKILREENSKRKGTRKSKKRISARELDRILTGASAYCERLKKSAFHFFCHESIVETHIPLDTRPGAMPYISARSQAAGFNRQLDQVRRNVSSFVKKYLYSYRLIKNGDKIKEERDWLSSHDDVKVERQGVARDLAFISEKAVFAPVTLLDKSRRNRYNYTFLRYDNWRDRPAAVIEARPKPGGSKEQAIYGDIWIDTGDFSVLKIEADPRSVHGYDQLKILAKKLRTRLFLSLETEFGKLVDGIRFPTRVSTLQKYRGGRTVSRYKRGSAWERSRVVIKYSDYRFFNVQMDVSIQ